jgi:mannose-1-phosphate guanylyltransferase
MPKLAMLQPALKRRFKMAIGILLVGGLGTRLKPLTNQTPKPMLPVGGLPVTEHQLLAAKKAGITKVVLATSYLSEVFIPYFGDGSKWGMELKYAVEKEPLGTGGAIRNAAALIDLEAAKLANEEFVIFNGDVLSHHSIADQITYHRKNKADVTLHLISVADARAFGCVPTDSQGRVTAFLEKMDNPVTNAINAGCYVFSASVISDIPLNQVVSVERETFPSLVNAGRPIFGYSEQSYWLDIGTPAALFKGSRDLVNGDFAAGAGTSFGSDSSAKGGSSIGSNCQIGQGVSITNSIIGDDVQIGDGADIKDSFILHGTVIAPGSKIFSKYLSATENLEISPA